MESSRHRV